MAELPIPNGPAQQSAPGNRLVKTRHARYARWKEDEARSRASYLATRRYLAPFLVPHRFEGSTPPVNLRRAQFGYGVRLNRSYVDGLQGHVRGADKEVEPGPLTGREWDLLSADATGTGVTWDEFFGVTVLEWMLTAPGGLVVVDTPAKSQTGEAPETKADEERLGLRPTLRFVAPSDVWDYGVNAHGLLDWVVIRETKDTRRPGDPASKDQDGCVLYELAPDGTTLVTHYDHLGALVGEPAIIGPLVDLEKRPILPIVVARYGDHPEVALWGSGLLQGLDDIIIDLYNLLTEVREAYRDTAFGLMVYGGEGHEDVQKQLEDGSRFVALGPGEHTKLERLAAESSEVEAGLRLVELALRNWSESAAQAAADAAQVSASARSGLSLLAEFQLDQRPLLVRIATALEQVETNSLYVAALLWGKPPESAEAIEVEYDRAFRQEDEASRIARLVKDFLEVLPLPGEAQRQAIIKWVESSGLVDMDEEVPGVEGLPGQRTTLGDIIRAQAGALGEARQSEAEAAGGARSPLLP